MGMLECLDLNDARRDLNIDPTCRLKSYSVVFELTFDIFPAEYFMVLFVLRTSCFIAMTCQSSASSHLQSLRPLLLYCKKKADKHAERSSQKLTKRNTETRFSVLAVYMQLEVILRYISTTLRITRYALLTMASCTKTITQ